jgi:hypothetical protein
MVYTQYIQELKDCQMYEQDKYWILNASKTYDVSVTTYQYILPHLFLLTVSS